MSKKEKKALKKAKRRFQQKMVRVRDISSVPQENQLIFHYNSGICFGLQKELGQFRFVGKPSCSDGHILGCGGPGSGKTDGPVKWTAATWNERLIIIDIKGDGNDLEHIRRKYHPKRRIKIFNPLSESAAHYDPSAALRYGGEENLARNARDMALAILPTPPKTDLNKVWLSLAQNLLTASIIYYYSIGADFNLTMFAVQNRSVRQLVDQIFQSGIAVAQEELMRNIPLDPKSEQQELAQLFVSKLDGLRPEVLAGVGMDFGGFVALAADSKIQSAFSVEDAPDVIDWHDFLSDEKDYDVILQIPENLLDQWEPMLTIMLTQLFRTLVCRPNQYSEQAPLPLLILLDEFPRLGTCDTVKHALATLRSRGVTLALFIQSLSQLDERYGKEGRGIILGCCAYKLLLSVTEPEDQEYFSRMIGETPILRTQMGVTFHETGKRCSRNYSFSEEMQRIVVPENLGFLKKKLVLLTPNGPCLIRKAAFHKEEQRKQL